MFLHFLILFFAFARSKVSSSALSVQLSNANRDASFLPPYLSFFFKTTDLAASSCVDVYPLQTLFHSVFRLSRPSSSLVVLKLDTTTNYFVPGYVHVKKNKVCVAKEELNVHAGAKEETNGVRRHKKIR